MLNVVPLSLRIMGVVPNKWVWLAKFPQTEPPLKNPAYATAYVCCYLSFSQVSYLYHRYCASAT